MKYHEYANLFPMMPEMDIMRLAEDIKEKGQSDPIITLDGAILDGRNRFKACGINNITPRFEEYTGTDPLGFVVSHNLHRRHLDETQRGVVGAKIADLPRGRLETNPPIGGFKAPTRAEVAKMLNVGHGTIDRAKRAMKNGVPELVSMMEGGDVTAYAASMVATLPEEDQRKAVSGGVAGVKEAAKKLKEVKKQSDHISESDKESYPAPNTKTPKWIPDDGKRLWLLAKTDLDKILKSDKYREEVMNTLIKYATNRLENNI